MLTTKFNNVRLYRVNGHLVLAQCFTDTQSACLQASVMTLADLSSALSPKRPFGGDEKKSPEDDLFFYHGVITFLSMQQAILGV